MKEDPLPRMAWGAYNVARGRGLAALDPSRRFTLPTIERRMKTKSEWIADRSPIPAPARTSTLSRSLSERGIEYLHKNAADPRFSIEALGEMTRALRESGIRVVLLTLPNHRLYRELHPPEWQRLIESVAGSSGVEHWDYRADPRFGDDDFNNATHLNAHGAARFTEILAERLTRGAGPASAGE
jgi:hypothetical protein